MTKTLWIRFVGNSLKSGFRQQEMWYATKQTRMLVPDCSCELNIDRLWPLPGRCRWTRRCWRTRRRNCSTVPASGKPSTYPSRKSNAPDFLDHAGRLVSGVSKATGHPATMACAPGATLWKGPRSGGPPASSAGSHCGLCGLSQRGVRAGRCAVAGVDGGGAHARLHLEAHLAARQAAATRAGRLSFLMRVENAALSVRIAAVAGGGRGEEEV